MITIILDAGHGGSNLGSVYRNRYEKDDVLKITLQLKTILEGYNMLVILTRDRDFYLSPLDRAKIAKQTGGALFLSIHRMSAPTPNTFSGVRALLYRDGSLPEHAANHILRNLEVLGFKNHGIEIRQEIILLRETNMPSLRIDIGYIDSCYDNELFDNMLIDIAHAIAQGIVTSLESMNINSVPSHTNQIENRIPLLKERKDKMAKVILDAAQGGGNLGVIYDNRFEKNDTLRLVLAVGEILERRGIEVFYIRNSDRTISPSERVRKANEEGGDLLVSIIRKIGPAPNTFSGSRALIHEDKGINVTAGNRIVDSIDMLGLADMGIDYRSKAILRDTTMPSVIIAVGFIDNEYDNTIFDIRFNEIANAIADGIITTLTTVSSNCICVYRYRVQVISTQNQFHITRTWNKLLRDEYQADMVKQGKSTSIQVGDCDTLDDAINLEKELRTKGFNTIVIAY